MTPLFFRSGLSCVVAGVLFVAWAVPEPGRPSPPLAMPETAFRGFEQAVARHVALHAQLSTDWPGATAGSSAGAVETSILLARALRNARPRASRGDFFDGPSTDKIRRHVQGETEWTAAGTITSVHDAGHAFRHPRIHADFPDALELTRLPQSLVKLLPILPAVVEYRIVGDYLVLRDVRAALVLDYVAGAVFRRER